MNEKTGTYRSCKPQLLSVRRGSQILLYIYFLNAILLHFYLVMENKVINKKLRPSKLSYLMAKQELRLEFPDSESLIHFYYITTIIANIFI